MDTMACPAFEEWRCSQADRQVMATPSKRLIALWIGLLPVGALLLLIFTAIARPTSGSNGFGSQYGFVRGHYADLESGQTLEFSGTTQPEWRWSRPAGFQYSELQFGWESPHDDLEGVLDLSSMRLTSDGRSVVINRDWFVEQGCRAEIAAAYMDLLTGARDGTLPRPRHHGHSYDPSEGDPYMGTLTHFSLGTIYPHSLVVWLAIWIIASLGVGGYWVCKRKRRV